jgi:hypothetical protein
MNADTRPVPAPRGRPPKPVDPLARVRAAAASQGCLIAPDVAELYGIDDAELAAWAAQRTGPAFIQLGGPSGRRIYPRSAVAADLHRLAAAQKVAYP